MAIKIFSTKPATLASSPCGTTPLTYDLHVVFHVIVPYSFKLEHKEHNFGEGGANFTPSNGNVYA